MTTEIDLVREKLPFVTNTYFLNKGNVKFVQIKQDTIRQKCCQNMKRDSVSAYVHIKRDTLSPCTQLCTYQQLCTYLIDGPFLNQKTYKNIRISYLLKCKHSKKYISLRKNK